MPGLMVHSDTATAPHRETKYRPGPDPHWPTLHRLGPRFIITRHLRPSFWLFICLHVKWWIIHLPCHRTFCSAHTSRSWYSDRCPHQLPRRSVSCSKPGRVGSYGAFAGKSTTSHADYNRRVYAECWPCNADLGSGTLVFGGLDRRSFCGISGWFGIVGDCYVEFFLPDPGTRRRSETYCENTAQRKLVSKYRDALTVWCRSWDYRWSVP